MASHVIELARQEGTEFRSVCLSLEDDGAIKMDAQDMGPTVTEIWTSTKLKTPVLTKVSSSAGEQTTYCKPTSTDEPHPSVFQIPPGYKLKKP